MPFPPVSARNVLPQAVIEQPQLVLVRVGGGDDNDAVRLGSRPQAGNGGIRRDQEGALTPGNDEAIPLQQFQRVLVPVIGGRYRALPCSPSRRPDGSTWPPGRPVKSRAPLPLPLRHHCRGSHPRRVRHATQDDLDRLDSLLAELREFAELRERKRGYFSLRSKAFLHFHEDAGGHVRRRQARRRLPPHEGLGSRRAGCLPCTRPGSARAEPLTGPSTRG